MLQLTDALTSTDYSNQLKIAQNYKAMYPNDVVILEKPTVKYNGDAFAWHRYFNARKEVWIDYPEAMVYMTDGSFLQKGYLTASDSYPSTTEIISYQTPSISDFNQAAVVYRASKKLEESKWGRGCLVRHEKPIVPTIKPEKRTLLYTELTLQWLPK